MSSAVGRRQRILEEIGNACALARRSSDAVELIAVSKGRSEELIEELVSTGQRAFGENRIQEAAHKWPSIKERYPDVRLHAIGRIQSNKAAETVRLFDVIHSLDRLSLLSVLVEEAVKARRYPSVYVQVNIGEEKQKGGCAIDDVGYLLDQVRKSSLPLAGLMAIPPVGVEPSPYFALLAQIARRHDVKGLSMGMSADFRAAVLLGATAVRIGTALFEG